ncbi:MAG: hypothetical protein ACI4EN_03535 [Butyrivibrio sp.]
MDKILCLLEKYRCHLKRGNKTSAEFLRDNFSEYVKDVKDSLSLEENPLVGAEMCQMVSEQIENIEFNANRIIEVLELYSKGKIVSASQKAFEVFENMKPQLMQRYSGAYRFETYYRIRGINEGNSFPLERKELFHIPYNKNYLVGTERYSMPGHPCLYLASQAELCWFECGKPNKFAISRFDIPQSEDEYMKFIDFSEKLMPLMHSFFCWFHNEKDTEQVRKYLLKYICTYPLRAACSIVVEHPGSRFIEEYIIPQLLLQWVLNDKDFDGIRYESCNSSEDVKSMGGHNIVLVTNNFDKDGYDISLRNKIKVGEPKVFDINTITIDPILVDCLNGRDIKDDPFLWGLEDAPNNLETI